MPDYTIPTLGARFSETLDYWNQFIDEYRAWLGGDVDGGPNSDGKYPLTNGLGVTYLLECPALLASSVTGPAALAEAARIAAEAAVSIAQTHATSADQQRQLAEAARAAAQAARDTAETAKNNAASSAAAAQAYADIAADHAEGLAAAIAQLEQGTSDLSNAVAQQAVITNTVTQAQAVVTAANTSVQTAWTSIQAANTNVNAARANVTTQAEAVATANTTVAANLATVLGAVSNAVAARDVAIGARDAAQAANTAAQAAASSTLLWKSQAEANAVSAANSAELALYYKNQAQAIVGGDFVSNADKATDADAEAGINDSKWMTPAKVRHAIENIAGGGQMEQVNLVVTATGSPQTVDLGIDVAASELLIFENGVEQNAIDFVKSGTQWTFTRPAGSIIRFMLAGGYRGQSFEPDIYGATLAVRDGIDVANVAVGTCFFDVANAVFYFADGVSWSNGITLQGEQGPQGVQGIQGPAGTNGANGDKGWAPILGVVSDGTRRVLQLTDWTGGTGTKPAAGSYIGVSGLTTLANAVDIRGPQGAAGSGSGDVLGPAASTDNAVARFDGGTGKLIQNSGVTINDTGGLFATGLTSQVTGGSSYIAARGDAGQYRGFNIMTGNAMRWNLYADNAPETGANAASNFIIAAYDDAGVFLRSCLTINRSTGSWNVAGSINPTPNNSHDLGSASLAWRNGYFQTGINVSGGGVTTAGSIRAGTSNAFYWTNSTVARANGDGGFRVLNSAETLTNLSVDASGNAVIRGGLTVNGANVVTTANAAAAIYSPNATTSPGSATNYAREDHNHGPQLATVRRTLTGNATLQASDNGGVVAWNAVNGTITLPRSLPEGFNCLVRVVHATGTPTLIAQTSAQGNAVVNQADGKFRARKQWSEVSASVHSSTYDGTNGGNVWVISGDVDS